MIQSTWQHRTADQLRQEAEFWLALILFSFICIARLIMVTKKVYKSIYIPSINVWVYKYIHKLNMDFSQYQ